MKRLAGLVLASGLVVGSVLGMGRAASATPFSDVPANHWAYQYIQSLAADGIIDGYPDGKFKGDRPLTRYEMAVVVARVIAKLQENQVPPQVTKADLEKLQKLIDALKDELDALGVRVTNLEDALDALDKRTKFAQSLSMHGVFLPNVTLRQRYTIPANILGTGTIDPFPAAFIATDDSNNPLTTAGSGIQIRQDSRFSLAYQITPGLTVSLPVHILNFEWGGEYSQNAKVDIEPGIDINLAQTGAISNLHFKFGILDNMPSSRTGLAFRAPFGYSNSIAYEEPYQPYQKGASVSGSVGEGAFGSTDFFASFSRVDPTFLDTQTGVTDPNTGAFGINTYLYPIVPPQAGFTQVGNGSKTDTFSAGSGTLAQVYLTSKAALGTVFVSYYNGTRYDQNGNVIGGTGVPAPAYTYNDAFNSVVFVPPLPAGSQVQITYRALTPTNNTVFQRYMINGRLNQKFTSLNGLEIGLTFNRIFDFDDTMVSNGSSSTLSQVFQTSPTGQGEVSDTVFGIDFQAKLPFQISGAGSEPVIFGEAASSKFTNDYRNVPAASDTAGLIGLRFKVQKIELSAQYQSVGVNFIDGAPFHYYGAAPQYFAFYKGPYFPDFFGFANNLGINEQFDNQFISAGLASPKTTTNPALTFIYPAFNPFRGNGPEFYQAFTPNSRGITASFNTPITAGDLTFVTRGQYQHLEEIRPNPYGDLTYGQFSPTSVPEKFDSYSLSTQFSVPAFGQKLTANISGTYEQLRRLDNNGLTYVPFNPALQAVDPTAAAAAANPALAGTGACNGAGPTVGASQVCFFPNYVKLNRYVFTGGASVPLTRDVSLGGNYTTQRYGGSYGTTTSQNISQRKDYYTGTLTYVVPKTNSSLSFIYRNYRYQDDVIPQSNLNQNREDLNFTVRF